MTDRTPPPAWYAADDLAGFEAWCWARIGRGVADRRSPFHTPTLANVTPSGAPDARTLVLRGCDARRRELRFHTDRRAGKVDALAARPDVCVHFYDAGAKLQLRCAGVARCFLGNEATRLQAWEATRSFSRECYRVAPQPATRLEAGGAYKWPARDDEGLANFAVLVIAVERVEALYLAHSGHRRATFGERSSWLVP